LEARRRLAAGLRPARPADAEARERFLAVERIARLPAAEQARELARFYRELAPRYMNPGFEDYLSSAPTNILDRRSANGFSGNTALWAKQLTDAASNLTAEQAADKLQDALWLDVASRARAIQVLKANAKATEILIQEDLKSGQKLLVQRAGSVILSLNLKMFNDQLLAMFLADGELSGPAGRVLLWAHDPALVQPLLARVEKDPKFLARCAGLFQGLLHRKPAEPILLKLLDSPDVELRYHAGYALYECRDPKLAAPAVRFAREKEPRFRVMAAYLASNLPSESFAAARKDLMSLLTDGDESVRIEALRCFAQQEDLAACPVILDSLMRNHAGPGGQHEVTVMQALAALAGQHFGYDMHNWGPGSLGNQQAIGKFEAWMASRGVAVPRNFQPGAEGQAADSSTASLAASPAEIERLIGQLSGEKFAQREAAQQALVKIGLPAVALLQKAAADENAERSGRAKAALKQIEDSAWGQPNQGLRVRLLPLRSTWRADQAPQLSLDIRNGGRRAVECSNAVMLYCQVQVDGLWHSWAKPFALGLPIGMLAPGKEYTLKLRLTDDWGTPPGDAPGVAAKDTKWLRLAPGSHLVRVSFTGYPELGRREGGIRCESNPVQVEIEGRSAATKPDTQPAARAPITAASGERAVIVPAIHPPVVEQQAGFPPRSLTDQPTEGGELQSLELSNGVKAERVFKDGGGRVLRRIRYVSNRRPFVPAPVAPETDLLEHSTIVYHYDAPGQLFLEATYDGRRRLAGTVERYYWPDGKRRLTLYKRYEKEQGFVCAEERYNTDGLRTTLAWSGDADRRLTGITGLVPDDVDLSQGWGKQTSQLQSGLVADGAVFHLIIKNLSSRDQPLPQGAITELVRPELVSVEGKTLPYDPEQIERSKCSSHPGPRTLKPRHAATEFYRLADWYGKIPPGKYTLLIRRLANGGQFSLISNAVDIEITAPRVILTSAKAHLCLEVNGHSIEVSQDKVVQFYSGLTEGVSAGTSMTVEGVSISAKPGRVELSCKLGTWTASLADGQVRLVHTDKAGATHVHQAPQFRLEVYQGQVRVLQPDNRGASPKAKTTI
jgi:HEAT repeat protein